MKQITLDNIDEAIALLPEELKDHIDYLLNLLEIEQPYIYDFLHNDYDLNEDELNLLHYIALIAWFIIKNTLNRKEQISEEYIYEQYGRNFVLNQDEIFESDKSDSEIDKSLSYPNNQPVLIEYIIYLISQKLDEPAYNLREEFLPAIITDAKTVIDCLVIDEDKALAETCDKDFSDEIYENIKSSIKNYYNEFKKTSSFMKLKHKEKKEAESIISAFSEMMYRYFLMQPVHWNARRSIECVTEKMPAHVMADDEYFEAIEPVLVPFMIFCADKKYVSDGKNIAGRLEGITERIMEEITEEESWGMGKSLLKDAEKQGYDLSKKSDIDAFMKSYNKDKVGPYQPPVTKNDFKPGRNDPCPCGSGKKYKKCCGGND